MNRKDLSQAFLIAGIVNIVGVTVVVVSVFVQAFLHKGYCLIFINGFDEMWLELFVAVPFLIISVCYVCLRAWKKR